MKKVLSVFLVIAMMVSLFTALVSAEEVKLISAKVEKTIEFSDVNKDTVSGQAIYKLAEAGVLLGDGDGTFRPDDPISRGELTKIVNMLFNYTEKDTEGFTDVTPENWYYDNVLIAKKAGYILGHGDGTFKGEDRVTREQACAILCRVAKLETVSEDVKINDAVSDWAMPYIQKVIGNMFMSLEKDGTFRAQENITRSEFSVVYANFAPEKEAEETTDKPSTGGSSSGGSSGGSSSGGSSGGSSSGGSSGGSSSGGSSSGGSSSGGTTPNYEEINKDMLANLNAVSADITANVDLFTTDQSRKMLRTINKCIKKVIADGKTEKIDTSYLLRKYRSDVEEAKGYLNEIKSNAALKSAFNEDAGTLLNSNTIYWLLDAFGVDTSELMN